MNSFPSLRKPISIWLILGAAAALALMGAFLAQQPLLILPIVMAIIVLVSIRYIDALSIIMFCTLPYMAVNLPTGAARLKLSDAPAYLFAMAVIARALLQRKPLAIPPPTIQVLLYIAALAISVVFSPTVPLPYVGYAPSISLVSPNLRSFGEIFWACLSWMVVIALYNFVGSSAKLLRRCLCAHIIGSGVAMIISLGMLVLGVAGMDFYSAGRDLLVKRGETFRLAGVAYEPLFLGFYLTTAIPITLTVMLFHPDWLPKRLLQVILILQLIALLCTFSTGAWISIPVTLLCMYPLWRGRRIPKQFLKTLGIFALTATLLVVVVFTTRPGFQKLLMFTIDKIAQGGDTMRLNEVASAMGMFLKYPIFGIGTGMAGYHMPEFHPVIVSQFADSYIEITPLYPDMLAEIGVVGFFAMAGCALAGLSALLKTIRKFGAAQTPILTALTASLIGCSIDYWSIDSIYLIFFPALIGLALSAMRIANMQTDTTGILQPKQAAP